MHATNVRSLRVFDTDDVAEEKVHSHVSGINTVQASAVMQLTDYQFLVAPLARCEARLR